MTDIKTFDDGLPDSFDEVGERTGNVPYGDCVECRRPVLVRQRFVELSDGWVHGTCAVRMFERLRDALTEIRDGCTSPSGSSVKMGAKKARQLAATALGETDDG